MIMEEYRISSFTLRKRLRECRLVLLDQYLFIFIDLLTRTASKLKVLCDLSFAHVMTMAHFR